MTENSEHENKKDAFLHSQYTYTWGSGISYSIGIDPYKLNKEIKKAPVGCKSKIKSRYGIFYKKDTIPVDGKVWVLSYHDNFTGKNTYKVSIWSLEKAIKSFLKYG